ncbi:MAG: XdhC family protein [Planctomycetota bacterium]|jgi:xanthine dehydrogenase accessory factor|nr:XdhC family protein [Planctomycetota bacterium]
MQTQFDMYDEIVRLRNIGEPAALCTVLLARGSTPGKETMKMLVRGDGTTIGSVGGGCVEEDVRQMALEVIANDRSETKSFRLNQSDVPESGLICGGQVTILAEPVVPPLLVLYGAGHVAAAAARVAKECDLRVWVCDNRDEYANSSEHPAADRVLAADWPKLVSEIGLAQHHYLVVVTRGHKDDEEVLWQIYQSGCRPKYLGMIGSRAKKAQLDRILSDRGVPDDWLKAVQTPIGLDIGAKSSGEIAVSLVSQLVKLRRNGIL